MNNDIYKDGANFWRDHASRFGLEEAVGICGRYLDTQLRVEISPVEKAFCGELFAAAYEAAASRSNPAWAIYPLPMKAATQRGEIDAYWESFRKNGDAANALDSAINESCYKINFYNLDIAAYKTILEMGFERVNAVVAYNIHKHNYDGRYSSANKRWAAAFDLPEAAFDNSYMRAHPILIDGFANHMRELYAELSAERFVETDRGDKPSVVGRMKEAQENAPVKSKPAERTHSKDGAGR